MTEFELLVEDDPSDVPPRRRWLVPDGRMRAAVTVAAVLVIVGSIFGSLDAGGELPPDVALRVGAATVTEADLARRVEVLSALYGVQPPDDAAERDTFRRDAAKSMAVSLLIAAEAENRGIGVAERDAQEALDQLIDEQLPTGRRAFTEFLSDQGVAESDVRDEVTQQMRANLLFEAITQDVDPPTSEEVAEAFSERREEFVRPEQRSLRNIVVGTEAEAEEVRGRLEAEAFETVAREASLDASTREDGGELGVVTAMMLEDAYAQAAFAVAEGEVFGPVETSSGWNVGQVLAVTPAGDLALEDVEDALDADLLNRRRLSVWNDWLEGQLRDTDIVYAERYLPPSPDTPPGAGAGGQDRPGTDPTVQPEP